MKKDEPKVSTPKPTSKTPADVIGQLSTVISTAQGLRSAQAQELRDAAKKEGKATLTGKPFSNVNTTTSVSDLMKKIGI